MPKLDPFHPIAQAERFFAKRELVASLMPDPLNAEQRIADLPPPGPLGEYFLSVEAKHGLDLFSDEQFDYQE